MRPRLILQAVAMIATVVTALNAQTRWLSPGGDDIEVDVTGRLYVLNTSSSTVRVYDDQLRLVGEFGGPGWEEGRFDQPSGIWGENGLDIFVADRGNHRIERFDRQFGFLSALQTRDAEDPEKRFGYPSDVLLSRHGDLFVSDGENQRIAKIDRTSRVERTFGGVNAGEGRLISPGRMAIGPGETLFVIDGPRILAYDTFGNFLRSCYQGMWEGPQAIQGGGERLLVVDGGRLYCCERQDRGIESVDLALLAPLLKGEIRGVAAWQGRVYIAGRSGIAVIDDPWEREAEPRD